MFFYVSLFIACVISAILILYLYHAVADAGKAVYNTMLPSTKNKSTGHLDNVRLNTTIRSTATPWGWKGNQHETRERGPKPLALNGASGLDGFLNAHGNETASVGWPYREEKNEFAGKSYKVTRKTAANRSRDSKQPWGW